MPVPVLEFGDGRPGVPLAGTVVIGRASGCGVRLDVDGVAAHHAQLSVEADGRVYLHDLAGTLRNGAPVLGRQALTHGDELELGPVRLRLRTSGLPLPGERAQRTLQMTPEEVAQLKGVALAQRTRVPAAVAPTPQPDALPAVEEVIAADPLGELPPPAQAARTLDAYESTAMVTTPMRPSALKTQVDGPQPRVVIRTPVQGTSILAGVGAPPAAPPRQRSGDGATVVYAPDSVDAQAGTDPSAGNEHVADPRPLRTLLDSGVADRVRIEHHASLKRPPSNAAADPEVAPPVALPPTPGFDEACDLDTTDPDLSAGAQARTPEPAKALPSRTELVLAPASLDTRLRRAFAFGAHMLALSARHGALFAPFAYALALSLPLAAVVAIASARLGGAAGWVLLGVAAGVIHVVIAVAAGMAAPLLHELELRGAARRSEARARVAAAVPSLLAASLLALAGRAPWALVPALTVEKLPLGRALERARSLAGRDPTGSSHAAAAVTLATWLGGLILSPLAIAAVFVGARLHPFVGPFTLLLLFASYGALSGWLRAAYDGAWYEWVCACERSRARDRSLAPAPLRATLEIR